MMTKPSRSILALLVATGILLPSATWLAKGVNAAETIAVKELPSQTHIRGLAVDRQDPSKLLIATHH
uniref:hypothetical protein n=1 Tax=Microvirga roseola TaxID=2883126 RepID=UPI001E2D1424